MPVTLLDPQGQPREIPDDQVQAAIAAGGKKALKITDPRGTPRWIPEDQKDAALQAGGKLADESKGFLKSFADASGISTIGHAIANPGETFEAINDLPNPQGKIATAVKNELKRSGAQLKSAWNTPNNEPLKAVDRTLYAIPGIGGVLKEGDEQASAGNYRGAAGTAAGTLTGLLAPGTAEGVKLPSARSAFQGASEVATAAKNRIYPMPQNLPPTEAAARNLGKALVVPVQAMPDFIGAAAQEAGTIKAYASANNIPINSTVDLAKAAEATAKAVQDHFNTQILEPNAKDAVSVPSYYRGEKLNVEGSRATLGDINKRIDVINQELNPNFRKATQGQTSAANVSDADLIAEKRKLTGILHDNLAEATGLEPEDIASLRQQAGKLRTIADEVRLSANTNTTAAGKAAMGRSDIPTGTKLGMAERLLQAVRGGPEVIGNRAVNKAFKDVNPTELVLPNPRTNPAGAAASNPIPDQVASPQMIRPALNESMQEYIKRKRAAQAEREYRSAVGLQK